MRRLPSKTIGVTSRLAFLDAFRDTMFKTIVSRTLRVPVGNAPTGDGLASARRLDVALMRVGFKLSPDLMRALGSIDPQHVDTLALEVISAVRELVGDHVRHTPYFASFPRNVPSTADFWASCLRDVLSRDEVREKVAASAASLGCVNLLDLPLYGRVPHTFEEMASLHEPLGPLLKAAFKVLHLGWTIEQESESLYRSITAANVPQSPDDLALLRRLMTSIVDLGGEIPMRETRAVVNAERARRGQPIVCDTATDVLRCAAELSGGDVTLETVTKFKSPSRSQRRVLVRALDGVIAENRGKIGDVARYSERWKRLGEKLHPHEFDAQNAHDVFALARGELPSPSIASRAEREFLAKRPSGALAVLRDAPGMLARSVDRLLVAGVDASFMIESLAHAAPSVSGRVLLGLREHLQNRATAGETARIFPNRKGKAWVTPDTRPLLDSAVVVSLSETIDSEIARRLPALANLIVDPAMLGVALPLTEKHKPRGCGVLPRGSRTPLIGDPSVLRFFTYWRQTSNRTDYDLSVLTLSDEWQPNGQCSYTSLKHGDFLTHSGDITEAPAPGSTEFIDVALRRIPSSTHAIVPQINLFSGEDFETVAESFFGFMGRESMHTGDGRREPRGLPFEASTVQAKSELHGKGKVALPVAFIRGTSGWEALWLHLALSGIRWGNRVEQNRHSVSLQISAIANRRYLTVGYLASMLAAKAVTDGAAPITYIGDNPPAGSRAYTPISLAELIPA